MNYQGFRGVFNLMGKTSLKTFVCSFVLSLFTIISVNKEFFGVSKPSEHEIKIPTKNISLFFKDMPSRTAAVKTIPIKKIALSVPLPAKVKEVQTVSNQDLIPLTFAENSIAPEPALHQETASPPLVLPKPVEKYVQTWEPPAPRFEEGGRNLMAEKIAANYQEIIRPALPINDEPLQEEGHDPSPFSNKVIQAEVKIIRPNQENTLSKETKPFLAEKTVLAQAEIPIEAGYAKKAEEKPLLSEKDPTPAKEPESFTIAAVPDDEEDEELNSENVGAPPSLPPTFKIARAALNPETTVKAKQDIPASNITKEAENLLIPLQKDIGAKPAPDGIIITESPDSNKLAMLTGKATIRSMTEENEKAGKTSRSDSGWKTMAEKNHEDSTWIAAKGTGHQHNSQLVKKKYFANADSKAVKDTIEAGNAVKQHNGSSIKVASEVVNNLLIPIPEEILNDPNLTPQLASSDKDKSIEEQLSAEEGFEKSQKPSAPVIGRNIPSPRATDTPAQRDEKGLFKSITSIFSKGNSTKDEKDEEVKPSSFLDSFTTNSSKKAYAGKILPTEIRLAFQPGRAEISGVTLKWIQAFANKTIEDDSAGLEIRIDGGSSYELQQKRLNLLHNILTNSGVDYRKIHTVFTTREPNSFIIRTVRLNNNTNGGIKEDNEWQDYYRAW